jgi:hypothetical protein
MPRWIRREDISCREYRGLPRCAKSLLIAQRRPCHIPESCTRAMCPFSSPFSIAAYVATYVAFEVLYLERPNDLLFRTCLKKAHLAFVIFYSVMNLFTWSWRGRFIPVVQSHCSHLNLFTCRCDESMCTLKAASDVHSAEHSSHLHVYDFPYDLLQIGWVYDSLYMYNKKI